MSIKTPLAIALITVTATFGAAPATADANWFKSVWKAVSSPVEAAVSVIEATANGLEAIGLEAIGDEEAADRSWKRSGRHLRDAGQEVLDTVEGAGETAIGIIAPVTEPVMEVVVPVVEGLAEGIEAVADGVEELFEELFEGDWTVCDCSKTMEEQGVTACVPPSPACPPDSPHEMGTPGEDVLDTDICGLIRYVRMDGNNSIYRGVRYGSAWIVESESGQVVGASKVHIVADTNRLWSLNPNQGWNCGNPW